MHAHPVHAQLGQQLLQLGALDAAAHGDLEGPGALPVGDVGCGFRETLRNPLGFSG